jgi:nucleolar protein 58
LNGSAFLAPVCYDSLKLKALHRFTSTATAVEDMTALQKSKVGKGLKKFLTDEVLGKGKGKESLVVVDPHLGSFRAISFSSSMCSLFDACLYLSLGHSISKKLSINVQAGADANGELWRGIRLQLAALLDGLDPKDLATMSLGLSHSLSRYGAVSRILALMCLIPCINYLRFKLKFSPDKVDTMVVQAIHLLDDLDKEINVYSMRVKV